MMISVVLIGGLLICLTALKIGGMIISFSIDQGKPMVERAIWIRESAFTHLVAFCLSLVFTAVFGFKEVSLPLAACILVVGLLLLFGGIPLWIRFRMKQWKKQLEMA